jgi:deoxyribodipyrimidine photo-lyase
MTNTKTNDKITGLFIFHRDFRIQDNRGLNEFCELCDLVIPVFIFTPTQIDNDKNTYKSIQSVRFMIEALADLDEQLDNTLLTFYGNYNDVLRELHKKIKFNAIGFNQDITPYSLKRTQTIKKEFETTPIIESVKIYAYDDYYLCDMHDTDILNDGNPYVKFSAFEHRALEHIIKNKNRLDVIERTRLIKRKTTSYKLKNTEAYKYYISLKNAYINFITPSNHSCCKSSSVYGFNIDYITIWSGTRENCFKILKSIKNGDFNNYGTNRNTMAYETTRLSAYLKYGLVSVREAALSILNISSSQLATYKKMKSNMLFRQLIWRDFYAVIVYYIPRVLKEPFQEKYKSLRWENNKEWTNAWKNAKTGFPIIDACMTELNTSGYMHNRGRLIVSSFLVKLLLTDWREGERYFATMLVDYDPCSNNGNWQWIAGTGTDTMPYFRIFNPWAQSKKHDADAVYIKKWLPQLEHIDPQHIHEWDNYYTKYNLKEINYTAPIIDYTQRRKIALDAYKNI